MIAHGILRAARLMQDGGVVAYPTESCFGLGCDPVNRNAVYRILKLKQRPLSRGLILVAASFQQLRYYLGDLPPGILDAPMSSWPGPFTWILPAARYTPDWITGMHDSVAVRVSNHAIVVRLCNYFGGAIVSTSANPHGRPPATNVAQARRYFGTGVDSVVRGMVGEYATPTEIRDAANGTILRSSLSSI